MGIAAATPAAPRGEEYNSAVLDMDDSPDEDAAAPAAGPRVLELLHVRIVRSTYSEQGTRRTTVAVVPSDEEVARLEDRHALPTGAKTPERDVHVERVERAEPPGTLLVLVSARHGTTRTFITHVVLSVYVRFDLGGETQAVLV